MEHLKDILTESLLDVDKGSERADAAVFLEYTKKILQNRMKNHTKLPIDMFGREISVGDICFAYISAEFHMIQVKEIINDGGWAEIEPTEDFKYIDGQGIVHPSCCILIPKKRYNEFLKVIKK